MEDPASYKGVTGPASWQEMWQNPEAEATTLNAMILSKFGEEALDWDPITIQMEIQEEYGVRPAEEVMNKISAMQVVMLSADFFQNVGAFQAVCNAISGGDPFFQVFTPLQAEEMAWGIATVGLNRDLLPFSDSIRTFVKISMSRDGYDEGNFPQIFSPVFDRDPDERDVRKQLESLAKGQLPSAAVNNAANIDSMIRRNLLVCLKQLDSLPGLNRVDDTVLKKGVLRAIGEDGGKVPEVTEANH